MGRWSERKSRSRGSTFEEEGFVWPVADSSRTSFRFDLFLSLSFLVPVQHLPAEIPSCSNGASSQVQSCKKKMKHPPDPPLFAREHEASLGCS